MYSSLHSFGDISNTSSYRIGIVSPSRGHNSYRRYSRDDIVDLMHIQIMQYADFSLTYVWHIITAENLVFGIVLIILSFQSEKSKIRFAAWMIVSLLLIRLMVILSVTAFYDVSALTNTLIDSIAILIYAAFIILGTRIKKTRVRRRVRRG
ncbi:MerR family transcriptional regulator [Paenibacillus aceti]|uniref:MerR family transcriptional regulator n=1 Tax=Paenibacillus aceti TaxID=1820010 RepID=UPI001E5CD880|nr:MerR family transcriptional regulator [Paenibacillus aceti]